MPRDTYGLEQQAEWHLDRVDQRNLPLTGIYAPNNNGAGVNIYILDTGFRLVRSAGDSTAHPGQVRGTE